ncbi:MAG: hypothetical protein AVDCRST_MAG30-1075 [uncultured Solirubrobacteraceae bacterium]|uniref:Uncharacterized protein n=1 Tax=uncultured Solirubrobacteraceae bacterium TaxID=1162706 RepID=A0A6J4RZ41_9ACTN|nr:MAG: hypothetical protein AVDCRST_MAG30-1075 [uncultured Solirubrobacteraceae bacterium]
MDPHRLAELEAEEQHARRRRDLYKAKMYGPRPTEPGEMRELERTHQAALERLEHARAEAQAENG